MKLRHTALALAFLSTSVLGGVAFAQDQDHHDDHPAAQDQDHHDHSSAQDQDHRDQDRRDQDRHADVQDHRDNHHYVEHKEWRRGERLNRDDWDRGERISYRDYHLSAPPRGYEWRIIDGYYVLANIGNFQIRTVVRIQ
ncbi:MAG TPA: RcnB family protein [Terracidiphilus sp.]|nr:RcnB family protein [Terracidiphilus sp.]